MKKIVLAIFLFLFFGETLCSQEELNGFYEGTYTSIAEHEGSFKMYLQWDHTLQKYIGQVQRYNVGKPRFLIDYLVLAEKVDNDSLRIFEFGSKVNDKIGLKKQMHTAEAYTISFEENKKGKLILGQKKSKVYATRNLSANNVKEICDKIRYVLANIAMSVETRGEECVLSSAKPSILDIALVNLNKDYIIGPLEMILRPAEDCSVVWSSDDFGNSDRDKTHSFFLEPESSFSGRVLIKPSENNSCKENKLFVDFFTSHLEIARVSNNFKIRNVQMLMTSDTLDCIANWYESLNTENIKTKPSQTLNIMKEHFGQSQLDMVYDIRALLEAEQDTAKVAFWKAILLSFGDGGYPKDKIRARQIVLTERFYQNLKNQATTGDAEAIFLLAYTNKLNLLRNIPHEQSEKILISVAKKDFSIAFHYLALSSLRYKKHQDAMFFAKNAKKNGILASQIVINILAEGDKHMFKNATADWSELERIKHPEAILREVLSSLDQDEETEKESLIAKLDHPNFYGHPGCLLTLINLLSEQNIPTNTTKIQSLLTIGSERGFREAEFELALHFYNEKENRNTMEYDEKIKSLLLSSSLKNHPLAMQVLGALYKEGLIVEQSTEFSNFWLNQAAKFGVGERVAKKLYARNPFDDFVIGFNDLDAIMPSYIAGNLASSMSGNPLSTGQQASSFAFQAGLEGLFKVVQQSRVSFGPQPNYLKEIAELDGVKIYGGQLSSGLLIPELEYGNHVDIKVDGEISVGRYTSSQSGFASPEGIANVNLLGFNISKLYSHGCVLIIYDGEYKYCGKGYYFENRSNKPISLIVNDSNASNNEGSFDVRIEVYD